MPEEPELITEEANRFRKLKGLPLKDWQPDDFELVLRRMQQVDPESYRKVIALVDPDKLKLPWTLVVDADPGCVKCSSEGVKGIEVRNRDGEVILHSGHETYLLDGFDLVTVVQVMNSVSNDV
jgi:hypothetical protein